MGPQFIPGSYNPAGWDVNGDGKVDVTMRDIDMARRRPRGQEVRTLNQYTGYFSTDEGDYPVSVVANSIKEAAKILTMPGVFGQDSQEPTTIKYVKGMVAVSVPVHNVGFNTFITPSGAIDSGAYATPVHSEVQNGTDVIFTAFEPFGWRFVGWYKGDPDNGGQLVSKSLQSTIDVYDPYSTLVSYYAKYEFNPEIRNGRYIDSYRGWTFDLTFDEYSMYPGRLVLVASNIGEYYFVMQSKTIDESTGDGVITFIPDPAVSQPADKQWEFSVSIRPSNVGLNMTVENCSLDNPYGIAQGEVFSLRWTNDPNSYVN